MLVNGGMETASTEVTSIRRRNDIENSTCKIHRYFVDFESRIHVEISKSNRCHNFWIRLSKSMKSRRISTWNFNTESMANQRRCAHWALLYIKDGFVYKLL